MKNLPSVEKRGDTYFIDGKEVVFCRSETAAAKNEEMGFYPVVVSALAQKCEEGYVARHLMKKLGVTPPSNEYYRE
jgi:hypothetical protein